jgi:tetratricopeptide (TPR) repeat protein
MTTPTSVEGTLLARLGLHATASAQEVEAAHDGLVDYLEGAPADLQAWARVQIGSIDEAFALLSDPTVDRSALVAPAATAVATAPRAVNVKAAALPDPLDDDELIAQFSADPTSATAPSKKAKARSASATAPSAAAPIGSRRPLARRIATFGVVAVGVVAIAIAGFNLNGGTGVPAINGTPAPEAAASPGVDAAQVAALMTKISADPKDTTSLQSLADIYYGAGDYESAGGFLEKIVAVDPKNVTARIALGAALFNLGKADGAEEQWRAVLVAEPNNLEAHYDLGFMYLSLTPPDLANVRAEWGKVMTIAPDSDVAKTVATHLASLDASPAPSAASIPASAGPSVVPSAAPAASPAASGK